MYEIEEISEDSDDVEANQLRERLNALHSLK
jgi:hypothetical protein